VIVRKADPGYVFLEQTIHAELQKIRDPNGACDVKLVPDSFGTQISVFATNGTMGGGRGEYHAAICNATAMEIKYYWVWDE
jgi:hypothetical protein